MHSLKKLKQWSIAINILSILIDKSNKLISLINGKGWKVFVLVDSRVF